MSSIGTFKIRHYCKCGASMTGSGAGDLSATDQLSAIWWSIHDGDGHGPATQREAAAARRREARSQTG